MRETVPRWQRQPRQRTHAPPLPQRGCRDADAIDPTEPRRARSPEDATNPAARAAAPGQGFDPTERLAHGARQAPARAARARWQPHWPRPARQPTSLHAMRSRAYTEPRLAGRAAHREPRVARWPRLAPATPLH